MKLHLTELGKSLISNNNSEKEYHELNKMEALLVDAESYILGVYVENEFDDLDEWCHEVAYEEYLPSYLEQYPNVVKDKIKEMIDKNIIYIS